MLRKIITPVGTVLTLLLVLELGAVPAGAATKVPPVPAKVQVADSGYEFFTVKWAASKGADSYKVKIATNSSFTKGMQLFTTTSTKRKMTKLKNCTTYYFKVRALNSANGSSDYSKAQKITLNCYMPGKITGFKVAWTTSSTVGLDWTRPSNATRFVVRRSTSTDFSTDVATFKTTGSSFKDTTLKATKPGKSYYYRIEAYNKSNTTKVRISGRVEGVLKPSMPTGVAVAARSPKGVTLEWKASANAARYEVRLATDTSFTKNVENVLTADAAPRITLNGLKSGTKYILKVRALNGEDKVVRSGYTATVSSTTRTAGAKITAMSFNVHSAAQNQDLYPWDGRLDAVTQAVASSSADVLGVQEAYNTSAYADSGGAPQWETLREALEEEGYERALSGTDGLFGTECEAGSGCSQDEYELHGSHLYYNTETLEPLGDGGYFNLANPSCEATDRSAAWQVFRTKDGSGTRFLAVSTHLDYQGITLRGAYEDCRAAQAEKILDELKDSVNTANLPVVLLGDLNSYAYHEPVAVLVEGGLANAAGVDVPKTKANYNSYHGFKNPPPSKWGTRIDYIMASETVGVGSWKLVADIDPDTGMFEGTIPSDHHPIMATLVFPQG